MTDYEPTPPSATPYSPEPVAQRSPVLSILSLVFGILGVLGSLFLFGTGILPAVAAIVLGVLGRRKEPASKGLWLTGLILGIVGVVIAVIVWIAVGALVGVAASNGSLNN